MSIPIQTQGRMMLAWTSLLADDPAAARHLLDTLDSRDVFIVRALAALLRELAGESLATRGPALLSDEQAQELRLEPWRGLDSVETPPDE